MLCFSYVNSMDNLFLCGAFLYMMMNFSGNHGQTLERPSIKFFHMKTTVQYRFATTVVVSRIVNAGNAAQNVRFDATLPQEAFITEFKLDANGTIIKGHVEEKEKAKQKFEKAKAKGQSAAHISSRPQSIKETNKFDLEVNVAANQEVTFYMTYQELLRRRMGLYNLVVYINPGQVVPDLSVNVEIIESRTITTLAVPPLRVGLQTEWNKTARNEVSVTERPGPKRARISYKPDITDQQKMSTSGVNGQFVVMYDVDRSRDAGDLLLMDGYFVHFFAPEGYESLPMDVLFILDKSGSMYGRKISQLKQAMLSIVEDMKGRDRFSILMFDHGIKLWRTSLQYADKENVDNAKLFINAINADGGTNINDAMVKGMSILTQMTLRQYRAPIIIFLTDGHATSGETENRIILKNIRSINEIKIPIFSLAFGSGADYQLISMISAQNNGFGRKIYEDADATLQIAGLYEELSTVLMRDINFTLIGSSIDDTSVTQRAFNTYFKGTELIVAGRYDKSKEDDVQKSVVVYSELARRKMRMPVKHVMKIPSGKSGVSKMVERMWAYLTIKQMIIKMETTESEQEKMQLKSKVVTLSLKYQFVTPVTSMVVTLPEEDRNNAISDNANQRRIITTPMPPMPATLTTLAMTRGITGKAFTMASLASSTSSMAETMTAAGTTTRAITRTKTTTTIMTTNIQTKVLISYLNRFDYKNVLSFPKTATASNFSRMKQMDAKWRPNFIFVSSGTQLPLCLDLQYTNGKFYTFWKYSKTGLTIQGRSTKISIRKGRFSKRRKGGRAQITEIEYSNSTGIFYIDTKSYLHLTDDTDVDIQIVPAEGIKRNGVGYFQLAAMIKSNTNGTTSGIIDFFTKMPMRLITRTKRKKKNDKAVFGLRMKNTMYNITGTEYHNPRPEVKSCWYIGKHALKKLGFQLNNYVV